MFSNHVNPKLLPDMVQAAAGVAPGFMAPYAGADDPDGWLDCNGQSVLVVNHPDLFAKIGYKFGGSGANFNVPDLTGHTP